MHVQRLFLPVVALLLASVALVACTEEAKTITPTPTELPSGTYLVEMGDNWFNGPGVKDGGKAEQTAIVEVAAGPVSIHLKNLGSSIHNLHVPALDKASDQLQLQDETTFDLGEVAAGEYDFVCDFHPTEMFGRLVVK